MTTPHDFICFCNRVSRSTVQTCVEQGARTLAEVYDRCGAGTGPCGGSCRSSIQKIIHEAEHSTMGKTMPASMAPFPQATDAPRELVEAISLFNRRYYWEAHEVLEDIWLTEQGPARLFYQGLIQSAAALYHVLNANPKGVIRLAQEAQKKLRPYLPHYYEIALSDLLEVLAAYVQQSQEILGQTRPGFDYERLPQLRLGTEMNPVKNSP